MVPKPIWGAISSYFYPEEVEETVCSPVPFEKEHIDEDGWMLVGPKRAPSPDADEVISKYTFTFSIFLLQKFQILDEPSTKALPKTLPKHCLRLGQ